MRRCLHYRNLESGRSGLGVKKLTLYNFAPFPRSTPLSAPATHLSLSLDSLSSTLLRHLAVVFEEWVVLETTADD